jgi:hypothetical protein
LLVKNQTCCKGKKEKVMNWFNNRWSMTRNLMGTSKEGGKPANIDLKTLRVAPEQRRFGSGVKKPDNLSPQGVEKPIFEKPLITEAEIAVNERWRAIGKKMERYTLEQEEKIDLEWFNRVTAWCKSQGFTTEDFKPENFTRERQLVYSIETAAMLEECMEQMDRSLDEEQANQRPNTPPEQDTTGDSSGGSST